MRNSFLIAVTEAKHAAISMTEPEQIIRAAMKSTKSHWLVTDDTERFNAACGAAGVIFDERGEGENYEKLKRSIGVIRDLEAILSGVSIDPESIAKLKTEDLFPLLPMWHEIGKELEAKP